MSTLFKPLKVIFTCLFLTVGSTAFAQSGNYSKTPAVGQHLAYFDFMGADDLSSFGRDMKFGIAIHFQNNLRGNVSIGIVSIML